MKHCKTGKVSFWAFGIATLLFTAFGLAGFARFGDEVSACHQTVNCVSLEFRDACASCTSVRVCFPEGAWQRAQKPLGRMDRHTWLAFKAPCP